MSIDSPIPQRTISISINGDENPPRVTYSYWSPVTGEEFRDAPVCNLLCNRPTHFFFILDYESTLNGWAIAGTRPRHGSPPLLTTPGPHYQSVSNYNPHENDDQTIHFCIDYVNTTTGKAMSIDPQEGNIPGGD